MANQSLVCVGEMRLPWTGYLTSMRLMLYDLTHTALLAAPITSASTSPVNDATGHPTVTLAGVMFEHPSQAGTYEIGLTVPDTWVGTYEWTIAGQAGLCAIGDFGDTTAGVTAAAIAAIAAAIAGLAPVEPTGNADATSSLAKAIYALLVANNLIGTKQTTGTPASGNQVLKTQHGNAISTSPYSNGGGVFSEGPPT